MFSINKTLSFVSVFVLTATMLFVFSIPVAYATEYTVTITTDEDDGPTDCASNPSDCSLREALDAANNNAGSDTITLSSGTYALSIDTDAENANATGDLDHTDTSGTLTINGSSSGTTVISGSGITDRILHTMTSTALVVNDVVFSGGNIASDNGAGLYANGTVTINDSRFSSNTIDVDSTRYGAGIYCGTGTLALNNVRFTENSRNSISGTLHGGGLYVSANCSATVDDSSFYQNTSHGNGAGIYVASSGSTTTTITDTEFEENLALNNGNGGGLYAEGGTGHGTLTLERVSFLSNEARTSGGGVYNMGVLNMTNATFSGNSADDHGGGVYINAQTYTATNIAHSTFVANNSDDDNDATGDGGGIYFSADAGSENIRNSVFASNTTDNGGAASDCSGSGSETITSSGYNFISDDTGCSAWDVDANDSLDTDPVVAASTADNGGEVQTRALQSSSPAIDAVPAAACLDASGSALGEDARGLERPDNTDCESGAYELDQTDPVVSVTSGTDTIECGAATWSDAGATVTDNFSNGLTASASGSVTEETVGTYTITYTSTADSAGNTGSNTRSVTVSDTIAPTITVSGSTSQTITVGDSYTDTGAIASDICDSSVSVTTSGTVDTNTVGTYTLTYSASDDSGNNASAKTRTVTVQAAASEEENTDDGETNDESSDNETVDHGEVTTVEKNGASLTVAYADGESDTFEPFGGKKNFRYKFISANNVVLVTNSKQVKVYDNGELVASKKVDKKAQKKKYYILKTKKMYSSYFTLAILTAKKEKAKLTVFRLTDTNALKKKTSQSFTLKKRNPIQVQFKKKKKKIITTIGKNSNSVTTQWKLKKKGALDEIVQQ